MTAHVTSLRRICPIGAMSALATNSAAQTFGSRVLPRNRNHAVAGSRRAHGFRIFFLTLHTRCVNGTGGSSPPGANITNQVEEVRVPYYPVSRRNQ
jgi:hypothetical protein